MAHADEFFSQREQLGTMLAMSDFVVCCAPFTRETYHMLGETEFRAMKPSAYFINVGRGQLSGEAILIRALQEGWIAGAGLDAFEEEPLSADSPLWDMPNVVLIPHQSSNTGRYMARATEVVCENLRRYTAGESLLNLADPVRGF
jgi:phosphoglycerate dehydrogenase-like enzyme